MWVENSMEVRLRPTTIKSGRFNHPIHRWDKVIAPSRRQQQKLGCQSSGTP
jgi:hypothetical protein